MLQKLEAKLAMIIKDLEQSIANHNALLGAKTIVEQLIGEAKSIAPVVELIDPTLTPVIDEVEAVVSEL